MGGSLYESYGRLPAETSLKMPSRFGTPVNPNPASMAPYASVATGVAPEATGGGLGSIFAAIGSPAGAGITSLLSLVGGGIGAYQKWKQDEKDRRENKRQYEEMMAFNKAKFQADMELSRKQLGMNRAQFMEQRKQAREAEKRYADERNYSRANDMAARLSNLAQQGYQGKVNFMNIAGARSQFTGRK
jgi:hypothetical protein